MLHVTFQNGTQRLLGTAFPTSDFRFPISDRAGYQTNAPTMASLADAHARCCAAQCSGDMHAELQALRDLHAGLSSHPREAWFRRKMAELEADLRSSAQEQPAQEATQVQEQRAPTAWAVDEAFASPEQKFSAGLRDDALLQFDLEGAVSSHHKKKRRNKLIASMEDHIGSLHDRPHKEQVLVLSSGDVATG